MPKINVYLPDELAESVRETGIPVSAVCQRALELAVRRITAIREAIRGGSASLAAGQGLHRFTDRCAGVLAQAERLAGQDPAGTGTGHLLTALLDEGGNLALRVLAVLDIEPGQVRAELARRPAGPADDSEPGGARFGSHAAATLELAVAESIALGTNYVGCEHLLLGLIAEPDGAAGSVLRALGADLRLARKAVAAALAGYTHLQARAAVPGGPAAAVAAAVAEQLRPLTARLEELEKKVSASHGS